MIESYQLVGNIDIKIEYKESYSRHWKWPTKTLFVLKQIKRPISANEVLKVLEWYESKDIIEDKRTVVFAALTNLTKEKKIGRTKPGSEYVYSIVNENSDDTENIKIDLAK